MDWLAAAVPHFQFDWIVFFAAAVRTSLWLLCAWLSWTEPGQPYVVHQRTILTVGFFCAAASSMATGAVALGFWDAGPHIREALAATMIPAATCMAMSLILSRGRRG